MSYATMLDEVLFLRSQNRDLGRENALMRAALVRIDAINDNPACFSKEINDLCDPILRPHLNQQETSK